MVKIESITPGVARTQAELNATLTGATNAGAAVKITGNTFQILVPEGVAYPKVTQLILEQLKKAQG